MNNYNIVNAIEIKFKKQLSSFVCFIFWVLHRKCYCV